MATKLRQHPSLAVLWGMGAIVGIIFVNVFLAITLIGIPLIPLLSLTVIITSLVGSLAVALFVGQSLVSNRNWSLQQQFLVGLAVVTIHDPHSIFRKFNSFPSQYVRLGCHLAVETW